MDHFSKKTLTGGTGDVNPQFISGTAAQSAADTNTTTEINLPIQRIASNAPGQAVIMEVLKIWVNFPVFNAIATAGETVDVLSLSFATRNFGTAATFISTSSVFAFMENLRSGAFTAAGTFSMIQPQTLMWDLTDGAGHGVLVATDSMFVQAQSSGTGNANSFGFKLLYRWKRVSLTEYIGIVQSQS